MSLIHLHNIFDEIKVTSLPDITTLYSLLTIQKKPVNILDTPPPPPKKKGGFNLGGKPNKKPSTNSRQISDDSIQLELDKKALNKKLYSWYGNHNTFLKKYHQTPLYLSIGELFIESRGYPVFYLPLYMLPVSGDVNFKLCMFGSDYHFNKQLNHTASSVGLTVPQLPEKSEDLRLDNFFEDLTSNMVGNDSISLEQNASLILQAEPVFSYDVGLSKVKPKKKDFVNLKSLPMPANNFFDTEPADIFESNIFTASIKDSDLIQLFNNNVNIVIQTDLYPDSSRQQAVLSMYEQEIKCERSILWITDNAKHSQSIYKKLKKFNLHHTLLDISKSPSREHLIDQIATIMDTDWALQEHHSEEKDTSLLNELLSKDINNNATVSHILKILKKLDDYSNIKTPTSSFKTDTDLDEETILKWSKKLPQFSKLHLFFTEKKDFTWQDTKSSFNPDSQLLVNITRLIRKIMDTAFEILDTGEKIGKRVGLPAPKKLDEVSLFCQHIKYASNAPELLPEQLKVDWLNNKKDVEDLLALMEKAKKYRDITHEYFMNDIIQEPLLEIESRLKTSRHSFLRHINWKYRKDLERILKHTLTPTSEKDEQFWTYLTQARIYQQLRDQLKAVSEEAITYFGDYWQGVNTNLDDCKKQFNWLRKFFKYMHRHNIELTPTLKKTLLSKYSFKTKELDKLNHLKENILNATNILTETIPFKDDSIYHKIEQVKIELFLEDLKLRLDEISLLPEWHQYQNLRDEMNLPFIYDLIEEVDKDENLSENELPELLQKAYYTFKIELIDAKTPGNPDAVVENYKKAIKELDAIKQKKLYKLKTKLLERRKKLLNPDHNLLNELKILQHELKKQGRYATINSILSKCWRALSVYAPFWIVQPHQIAVLSEYINYFDTIIIDTKEEDTLLTVNREMEASQQLVIFTPADNTPLKWIQSNSCPLLYKVNYEHKDSNDLVKAHSFSIENIPVSSNESLPVSLSDNIVHDIWKHIEYAETQAIWLPSKEAELYFWQHFTDKSSMAKPIIDSSFAFIELLPNTILPGDMEKINYPYDKTSYWLLNPALKSPTNKFLLSKTKTADPTFKSTDLYQYSQHKINIAGTHESTLKDYKEQLEAIRFKIPANFEDLYEKLKSHYQKDWELFNHPENPFEFILKHRKMVPMSIYIWSDVSAESQTKPLVHYLHDIESRFTDFLYLPHTFYPLRIDEWLSYADESIETIMTEQKEKGEDLIALSLKKAAEKEEAEKQSNIGLIKPKQTKKPNSPNPKKEIFKTVDDQNKSVTPELAMLPKLPKYEFHEDLLLGTKKDLLDSSKQQVQKLILDIVEIESPIHWQNLLRCIASYYQIQQIDKQTVSFIVKNIDLLVENNEVFLKDDCLYNNENYNFKLRDRSGSIEFHRPEEIPPDECEAAIFEILRHFKPVSREILISTAISYLGFPFKPAKLRKILLHQLKYMGKQRHVLAGPEGYELKPEYYEED